MIPWQKWYSCPRFRAIYHSLPDYVALWLNCLLLFLGAQLLIEGPLEKIPFYHFLLEQGLNSLSLGCFFFVVGMMNVIETLYDKKPSSYIIAGLRCSTLSAFVLLFLAVADNDTAPLGTVFYAMTSLLALDNVKRIR
jgi:energy-converting hydrogenase Eha subunit C